MVEGHSIWFEFGVGTQTFHCSCGYEQLFWRENMSQNDFADSITAAGSHYAQAEAEDD